MPQPQPLIRLKQTKDLLSQSADPHQAPAASLARVKLKEVSSLSTNSQPLTGMPTTNNACVMWIHLQASICTEWEHSSMVVKGQQAPVSSVREVSSHQLKTEFSGGVSRNSSPHSTFIFAYTSLPSASPSSLCIFWFFLLLFIYFSSFNVITFLIYKE